MKNSTRMSHISKIIKRIRCGSPYVEFLSLWGFGSAMRGGNEPRDIDLVVIYKLKMPFVFRGCSVINQDKALIELRRGMKGVEFHPPSDVQFAGVAPMPLWIAPGLSRDFHDHKYK